MDGMGRGAAEAAGGSNTSPRDELTTSEALRELQRQFEAAERITLTGSWSFDLGANRVLWSAELFRILRLPRAAEAPPYETHGSLFSKESWERLAPAVNRAAEQGEPFELVLELAPGPHDERDRWAIARAEAERDADGKVARLFGTFQEVTELVRAQRAREEAHARVALATSATGIGVWDWDVVRNELSWDARMRALYGLPEGTPMSYEAWRSAVLEEDRSAAEAAVQAALDGERDFVTTFRVCWPDGSRRTLRASSTVLRDESGAPKRMLGVNWDVSVEAEAEAMRARAAAQVSNLVREAPVAIALLDRDLRYVEASDRWISENGLAREAVVGRAHADVFPGQDPRWRTVLRRVLGGEVLGADADAFVRPDGSTRWLAWEARPWREADGAVAGIVAFTRDVSERVRLEKALRARTEELERSNEDLRQFAYAASHDLQEPLRAVAGCAQLFERLHRDRVDEEGAELLRHMVEGAGRMRSLIDDLLAYSRVGTRPVELVRVACSEALDEARALLALALEESSASVTVGELPAVRGDRRQLIQLFQNILGNAVKYTRGAPPRVEITARRDGASWEISARDHGIGIPADARERVFGIFQRLHTREEYPGTGVGLALCRRIVERHGGRIWIAPVDGDGTDVRFTLPAEAP